MFKDQQKLFDTLFLLFLGTIGGSIGGGITSCKIQKIINDSVIVKQIIFFVIIYFTNSFVIESNNTIDNLKNSLLLFTIFVILMKSNYKSTIIVILLLFINKLLSQKKESLKTDLEKDATNSDLQQKIDKLNTTIDSLLYIAALVMLAGFVQYYIEKRNEYGDSFNIITFLLGSNKCKSLL